MHTVTTSPHHADLQQAHDTPLTHLALLHVAGADAASFLQGQVTCDIRDVTQTTGRFGAMCNAKGRVRSTFVAWRDADDSYWLILPACLRDTIRATLQKYVLRANVQLASGEASYRLYERCRARPTTHDAAHLFSVQRDDSGWLMHWPSADPQLRRELYFAPAATALTLPDTSPSAADAVLRDLLAGLPWLDAATSEQFIPQMLAVEAWQGISFNKGCYTGQEVVARAHYLGEVKRDLYRFLVEEALTLPSNSEILDAASGETVGHVVAAHAAAHYTHGLAVLKKDALGQALRFASAPSAQRAELIPAPPDTVRQTVRHA